MHIQTQFQIRFINLDVSYLYTSAHRNSISVEGILLGTETARKLLGLTPHDQLLIQISNSFAGLLLFAVGLLLLMVVFLKDTECQGFFAKGCVLLHVSMALWRVYFERRLEDLARDWPRQLVGDLVLAFSWILFPIYPWMEKYDYYEEQGIIDHRFIKLLSENFSTYLSSLHF